MFGRVSWVGLLARATKSLAIFKFVVKELAPRRTRASIFVAGHTLGSCSECIWNVPKAAVARLPPGLSDGAGMAPVLRRRP